MQQRHVRRVRQVTATGFVGGLLLIGAGVAGLTAAAPLVLVLAGLGAVGIAGHRALVGLTGHPALDAYLSALPAAPLLGAAVTVAFLGASPGELQTVGAVLGLLSVLNHLLRPLYALLAYVGGRLSAALA